MLKPGQLFNYKGKRYNVSKRVFTCTCSECIRFYENMVEQTVSAKIPCIEDLHFPCTRYCGRASFPKLIKMCKK